MLAATLGVFATMERNSRVALDTTGVQDETRLVVTQIARQLRNLASQSDNVFKPIERAEPQDIIFRTVRRTPGGQAANLANIQRVRYCLNVSRQLYLQTQILADASTAAPVETACPVAGTGWTTQKLLSDVVVNGTRPLFGYMLAVPTPDNYQEYDTINTEAQLEQVVGVRARIWVDDDVKRDPGESELNTRVFLRNQNRKPTASFTATQGAGMSLQLNAGDSSDPEGARLSFQWFDSATGTPVSFGTGAVFNATLPVGNHVISVTATDAAGNSASSASQSFTCSTATGCRPL
jgi:hypothetical protein